VITKLCICGHSYEEHSIDGIEFSGDCWAGADIYDGIICRCAEFKQENLNYLEECAEKRSSYEKLQR
jgi:hypothetical protein